MKLVFLATLLGASIGVAQQAPIPPSKSPLFNATTTVPVTLQADFTSLWEKYRTLPKTPGEQSDTGPEAYVPGTLTYQDSAGKVSAPLTVSVRVRGHSSQVDCTFPKLRLEFDESTPVTEAAVKASIFSGASSVKIGTHCSDVEGRSGQYNRLRNQKEPHREAVAYQILEQLGVPSFKARAAVVTYIDTGAANKITLRDGAFIESPNIAKKRYDAEEIFVKGSPEAIGAEKDAQAKGKTVPGYFSDAAKDCNLVDVAKVVLAEAILDNYDWDLNIAGHMKFNYALWNLKAYMKTDGTKFILPFDYDLAQLVTAPESAPASQAGTLTLAQNDFDHTSLVQAAQSFLAQETAVLKIVEQADFTYPDISSGKTVDDKDAAKNMKNFLTNFFKKLEAYK